MAHWHSWEIQRKSRRTWRYQRQSENEWKSPLFLNFLTGLWWMMDFLERICQLILRSAVCVSLFESPCWLLTWLCVFDSCPFFFDCGWPIHLRVISFSFLFLYLIHFGGREGMWPSAVFRSLSQLLFIPFVRCREVQFIFIDCENGGWQ